MLPTKLSSGLVTRPKFESPDLAKGAGKTSHGSRGRQIPNSSRRKRTGKTREKPHGNAGLHPDETLLRGRGTRPVHHRFGSGVVSLWNSKTGDVKHKFKTKKDVKARLENPKTPV